MDFKAFIQLEFQSGAKFRWAVPEKYAWKIFLERWAPRQVAKEEKLEDDSPFKKIIEDLKR
ncbi:hypothetical protein J7L27_00985 [Candidatus Bathyarchaeota archaeon]|nr:hypothetical protein [Candidatus Bathyarchaeota archaeon]